ncbi:MAG: repeat domain protein, partial [Labilithrix sp.]|nr:repeat domain protein [Labilithrix sp.]
EAIDAGPDGAPGATPVNLAGVTDVIDLAATHDRTCATLADGGVDCWGIREPTPTRVPALDAVKRFAPGASQADETQIACSIATDGGLSCEGNNLIIGTGSYDLGGAAATEIVLSPPSNDWWGVTASAFVLDAQGTLHSWGFDDMMLGRQVSTGIDYVPHPVRNLPKIRNAASSGTHACAVSTDGRLFCWGRAGNAMLGLGYVRDERLPVEVSLAERWPHQVSLTESHSCAATTQGSVYCWGGLNERGQLGVAQEGVTLVPRRAEGLPEDIVSVAVGFHSTCALAKNGVVWCWGWNDYGQLGRGYRELGRHPVPVPVVFP